MVNQFNLSLLSIIMSVGLSMSACAPGQETIKGTEPGEASALEDEAQSGVLEEHVSAAVAGPVPDPGPLVEESFFQIILPKTVSAVTSTSFISEPKDAATFRRGRTLLLSASNGSAMEFPANINFSLKDAVTKVNAANWDLAFAQKPLLAGNPIQVTVSNRLVQQVLDCIKTAKLETSTKYILLEFYGAYMGRKEGLTRGGSGTGYPVGPEQFFANSVVYQLSFCNRL